MKKQNYRVLKTLTSGSTSVIYEALQTSLDRKVIIKKLHPHLTSDPGFINRFEMEAKTAASLNHENIVRIIDSGKQNGSYYIVMEFIEGISLRKLIDKSSPLDEEASMLIAHGICMGLNHAHSRGIIHRDIKPANIMISNEGVVKITDFGLAKLIRSQVNQTQSGSLLGTPLYMSPEQAVGGEVDGRSDLFSLGTMCYEMVTGEKPFRGENYAAVIQNILSSSTKELSKSIRGSSKVRKLIMDALHGNPEKRFSSGAEMAAAIEETVGQEKVLSAGDILKSYLTRKRSPAPRRRRKKRNSGRIMRRTAASLLIGAVILALPLNPHQMKSVLRNLRSANESRSAGEELRAGMEGSGGFGFIEAEPEPAPPSDTSGEAEDKSQPEPSVEESEPAESAAEHPAVPEDAPAEEKTEPAQAIDEEEKIPSGYLDVHVKPEAAIFIDGKQEIFGNHLGPMPIKPGRHSLLIRRTGYENYTEVINIIGDELSRRRIKLVPVKGKIEIDTTAGARLFIDGEFVLVTPAASPVLVEAGPHRVKLVKEGFAIWENTVEVQPRGALRLNITMVKEKP